MSLFRWDVVALIVVYCLQLCFPHFSFLLTIYFPTLSRISQWGLLWLCAVVAWCFSMPFPRHAVFNHLTKPTLIHSSTQPSAPKGDCYFSPLAWFPKKIRFMQSLVLVCASPILIIFLSPSASCSIKFDRKRNFSKPINSCSVCGEKKNSSSMFPLGKMLKLKLLPY